MTYLLRNRTLRLGTAVCLTLIASLAVTFFTTQAHAAYDRIGNERGDNPVVGSLPCVETKTLDLMFWEAQNLADPNIDVLGERPTLALIGNDLLESTIIDATGDPFGLINHYPAFNVFGVHKEAHLTLYRRSYALEEAEIWMWLPRAYIGGRIRINAPFLSLELPITDSTSKLPVATIIALSGQLEKTEIQVLPGPSNGIVPTVGIELTVYGQMLLVDYEP